MQNRRNLNNLLIKPCQKTPSTHQQRINELELQLKEAKGYISVLKESNNNLLIKLSTYQRKLEDRNLLQDELNFRREEEKQMQEHMENYQNINQRLRQKVSILQNKLKYQEKITCSAAMATRNPSAQSLGNQENNNSFHVKQHRKSLGSSVEINQRQNHPLTPKSRVKIDLSLFSQPVIQAKRKVFF